MLYLTFRSGDQPETARVVAATSDPLVVAPAIRALLARLGSAALLEGQPDDGAQGTEQAREEDGHGA